MLMPKKTKYRKVQKGRIGGAAKGARTLQFGNYGLVAVESSWISARQIEAIRVAINRKIKKIGESHLRIFPDKPISKKPLETRMGKGKGNPEFWVAVVKRGRIIIEISGESIDLKAAREILQAAAYKLPIKTRIIDKHSEAASQALTAAL